MSCIKNNNKSIHVKILNEFKDIGKSDGINVMDRTDNYQKINEPSIIKRCTIFLIDDYNYRKTFISLFISRADNDDDDDDFVNDDNFITMIFLIMKMIVMMILFLIMKIQCVIKSL